MLAPDLSDQIGDKKNVVSSLKPRIRCREIGLADLEQVIDFVSSAYRVKRDVWVRRIKRLTDHSPPIGYPKYGFMLECEGRAVGTIFTMFSSIVENGSAKIRCYLITWYVDPLYRNFGALLASRALKYKEITYRFGNTPMKHVMPMVKAQGYVQWCEGRIVAALALSRCSELARVEFATPDVLARTGIMSSELELLSRHANFGCINLICSNDSGDFPFVFQPRRRFGVVSFTRLVYCRDISDLVRFAGPVGRFLLWQGYPIVVFDADGPMPGIIGQYSNKFPKFFRGPDRPRLGEDAYTSRVIFDW
jgi:hypothetical protein